MVNKFFVYNELAVYSRLQRTKCAGPNGFTVSRSRLYQQSEVLAEKASNEPMKSFVLFATQTTIKKPLVKQIQQGIRPYLVPIIYRKNIYLEETI